ncbi:MAG: oligopeptide transporter, OPT family [Lachnospiraceae bacterium]|jgi:putative OPT family oligopeptide transporter|nr:oligopeptide transporter, OPT family [Lachnospiraceae bacterium]MCH4032328.1 oligopeptide transporter, OPT family [Lachnospiraceae bacterium]MCH4108794.1 oligopeptide transporter, OPT family [Lachnospiraceae bacterium]MCI1302325.1 oligopeptide transporter, OPT family [Lachnospiraceae bacterium]MCI1331491.1 oligopeptide transporter, OPT family [Lachnospiraceae bacterium]
MEKGKEEFKPFISADRNLPELTPTSIILGAILAIVFGAANAYLGLRVGLTISASIPAAVISMGICRGLLRRDNILENNMVQTIGSAGESIAAGAIFTMPALFMWAREGAVSMPTVSSITIVAILGGVLGVLFMIPLRNALIVEEHGTLPYPEGTACSEVLLAGEEGGASAKGVFSGLGIAAVYKFLADGLKVFPSEIAYDFKNYKGAGCGMDVLPSLVGVGYICGPKISAYMFGGGILAWFVLMPLIYVFGAGLPDVVYPASKAIAELGTSGLWSSYIRYIGAGAVACGGMISLIKSFPMIIRAFRKSMASLKNKQTTSTRTTKDIPMNVVLIAAVVCIILLWLLPTVPVNLLGALLIVIFGFFFVTVSARMVGIVGSSNNPVSGMTIATLLITTIVLKATGNIGTQGMVAAISIGSVICIAAALAGDISQDLKTGYIVGATPWKQQIGEIIGIVVSSIAIGFVMYLLDAGYGFGSQDLPAPQAGMMKMIVEGVMNGNLPWSLVFVGVFIALIAELFGIPVLPFAVGIYLPIFSTTGIMVGGVVRLIVDKKKESEEEKKAKTNRGILFASGMIAGEGLVGVLLAVFAFAGIDVALPAGLNQIGSLVFFAAMIALFVMAINKKDKKKEA